MKLVKIGAVWCSSCLVMRSRLQEIKTEHSWLKIDYLDLDNDFEKVKNFSVESEKLPALIFLDKKGKEILRLNGEWSTKDLKKLIQTHKNK